MGLIKQGDQELWRSYQHNDVNSEFEKHHGKFYEKRREMNSKRKI